MRFALVGRDIEGLRLAQALVETGRHELLYVAGLIPPEGEKLPEGAKPVHDLEEILADPEVNAVLVASGLGYRAAHVRRVLQSERAVLCLHPIDTRPEAGYEAGMMQQDTRQVLLPLMPDAFHPAVRRFRSLVSVSSTSDLSPSSGEPRDAVTLPRDGDAVQVLERVASPKAVRGSEAAPVLGELLLVEVERRSRGEVLLLPDVPGALPCVPGWEVLRAVGGEIAEVSALVRGEELEGGTPVILAGRFQRQGLFQVSLFPNTGEDRLRVRVIGSAGEAELLCPLGLPGPAFLSWRDASGELREEARDALDPWPVMVPFIEDAFRPASERAFPPGEVPLSWQDEIHCLELDDAARRSVERRKVVGMEYPEASEEVSFKGTMTLVGCGLLWVIILMAIASRWYPRIGYAVFPILAVFLFLQLFRWIIPPREREDRPRADKENHR